MNVTAEDLRAYIDTFYRTLEDSAREFLPPEHRSNLFHISLLPARITGYVSTQFGVGIEYESASDTSVHIIRGSARVEDLFVHAPKRVLRHIPHFPLFMVVGSGIFIGGPIPSGGFIGGPSLSGGFPFRLANENASISFGDVTFEIGSWKHVVKFAEIFGNRNASNWSIGKAESRAKDEVLAAMLQLAKAHERKIDISQYIKEFKDKTVLVLGNYREPEGLNRLQEISQPLIAHGYVPILVKDIPDHPHHDLTQKVVAVGAISRFVVVEDSSQSGHLLEVQLCKQNNWVTILLRDGGIGGSWMTAGAAHTSNVIKELAYDPASPTEAIAEAVQWAEAKLDEIERLFKSTYPWRSPLSHT